MTFVKTKVALHNMPAGEVLEVLLKGEEALKNVPRAVTDSGYKVLSVESAGENHKIIILAK